MLLASLARLGLSWRSRPVHSASAAHQRIITAPRARYFNVDGSLDALAESAADRVRFAPSSTEVRGLELLAQYDWRLACPRWRVARLRACYRNACWTQRATAVRRAGRRDDGVCLPRHARVDKCGGVDSAPRARCTRRTVDSSADSSGQQCECCAIELRRCQASLQRVSRRIRLRLDHRSSRCP